MKQNDQEAERPALTAESVDLAMTAIAQGVINIHEGLCTIEAGSRVHRGMADVLRAYVEKRLVFVGEGL